MKKKLLLFFSITFLGLSAVIIFLNYKYPFFISEGGRWSVGFSNTSASLKDFSVNSNNVITYEFIDSITTEKNFYIADPFFIKERDTFFLFVEQKGKSNANIALLTSQDGKDFYYKGIVLDEDFHLSYPQVFKYRGEFFMLPETKGANQVLLYKAENFPYNWKIKDTLLRNMSLKDPTLLLSEEINLIVAANDNLKQYFFTSDSLEGDWTEVKNYKSKWGNETRPGGRFFRYNNAWYLPVQNRSQGYGSGISLYKLNTEGGEISLDKSYNMFLGPKEIKWFERGMHHLDLQLLDNRFYMAYDGDRILSNKKKFQFKRSLKLAFFDFYNMFQD